MEHFDAVVIGSGFGGSVAAYRLAKAGLKVCILERGRAYLPGSFPRYPNELAKNYWDPSRKRYGLFELFLSKKLGTPLVAGLGGGSLIYSAVLLRKDEDSFTGLTRWPFSRSELDPHYDRVEHMLGVEVLPTANEDKKLTTMRDCAKILNINWSKVPLGLSFFPKGSNGEQRTPCRFCAECTFGCNTGSKNSLDYNYLSEGKRLGAEIRVLSEVTTIAPLDRGTYLTEYLHHTDDASVLKQISSKFLILSAGSLNSTQLLLKNRERFPNLGRGLGTKVNGNGDFLIIGIGKKKYPELLGPGPVISYTLISPQKKFYIQELTFPPFVHWWMEGLRPFRIFLAMAGVGWRSLLAIFRIVLSTHVGHWFENLIGKKSAVSKLIFLGVIGNEKPMGRLFLTKKGKMELDWSLKKSAQFLPELRAFVSKIANHQNFFTLGPITTKMMTVHVLGGIPMGESSTDSVVDSYGEVHGFPRFFVMDGSILPGSVGVNPSLTIAAVADRCCDHLLAKYNH